MIIIVIMIIVVAVTRVARALVRGFRRYARHDAIETPHHALHVAPRALGRAHGSRQRRRTSRERLAHPGSAPSHTQVVCARPSLVDNDRLQQCRQRHGGANGIAAVRLGQAHARVQQVAGRRRAPGRGTPTPTARREGGQSLGSGVKVCVDALAQMDHGPRGRTLRPARLARGRIGPQHERDRVGAPHARRAHGDGAGLRGGHRRRHGFAQSAPRLRARQLWPSVAGRACSRHHCGCHRSACIGCGSSRQVKASVVGAMSFLIFFYFLFSLGFSLPRPK